MILKSKSKRVTIAEVECDVICGREYDVINVKLWIS